MERARTLLAEGKLFFPTANDFNDPFECDPMFNFESTARERKRYNMDLVRERAPNMPRHERRKLVQGASNRTSFDEAANRLVDRLKRTVGILSLCQRHDNLLMWAHYAESHEGICVEFRRDGPPLDFALKVTYARDYPRVDFFEIAELIEHSGPEAEAAQRKWVDAIFLTKSEEWIYESEWRILDTRGGRGLHDFDAGLLTKVYLGCKTSVEDEKRVREWVAQKPTDPQLFRAIREEH